MPEENSKTSVVMEIEFNPSRTPPTEAGQPVARPDKPTARASASQSSTDSSSLLEKLRAIPLLRSSMVDHALSLAINVKYPPDDVVDRIYQRAKASDHTLSEAEILECVESARAH